VVKDNKTAFDFNQVDAQAIMDPELFQPKETAKEDKNDLDLGKPLEFTPTETHSFIEWLQLSGTPKPIERTKVIPASNQSGISKKLELIDKFIASNPKIPPAG